MAPLIEKINKVRASLHNVKIKFRKLVKHPKLQQLMKEISTILDSNLGLIKYIRRETLTSLLFVSPLVVSVGEWSLPQ